MLTMRHSVSHSATSVLERLVTLKTDFRAKIRPGGRKMTRRAAERPLKIDPKVPNRRYLRGLQTGHRRNPGSYSKKRIFGSKSGPVARKRPQGHGGLGA